MKFNKGDTVPQEIITRDEGIKILFGVDVEVENNTIYPQRTIHQTEHLIEVSDYSASKGTIKFNYKFSMIPKDLNNLEFIGRI